MENNMEFLQKIKTKTVIWSSNSTSGYLSKENKNTNLKRYMLSYVQCSILYNSQDVKQPKCLLIDEWIKKMWYIYTMEYYSAIKKEWNLVICDNMHEPWEHYANWNKPGICT